MADTHPGNGVRHTRTVRITHWINVVVLTVMLGSGLQIFNAHPGLYWGSRSDPDRAWLSIRAQREAGGELRGVTRLWGRQFDTTGWLGVSGTEPTVRGFPAWATIPGPQWLAMGRRWHLFFAWLLVLNGLVYAVHALAGRHRRELLPSGRELRHIVVEARRHLSVRRLRREAGHGYNVLQKLSYLGVVFLLGPLVVLTGLTMSPWIDAMFPFLLDLFGGRQSARSLHFLAAAAFVLFFVVHISMVLLVGPLRHTRAMITGRLSGTTEGAP
jgi:thiosulfate reductase cytochrome b subunit